MSRFRLRLSRVALSSARVALVTTAIVAAVYLAMAAGVEIQVDRALTAQIDDQLHGSLAHVSNQPPPPQGDGFGAPPGDRYGPPVLVWTIHSDGTSVCTDSSAKLPAQYRYLRDPQTITVGGSPFRAQGAPIGDDHVVIGMSMASVAAARSTLISAEAIVGPILLVAVFLGAFTIGRRVAAPIESARQRQMEFTADASHELRTPLSVIEATTTLALSRQRDGAWYRNAFERVHVESGRMRKLVEDLLWLARFDATRGHPDAQPIDAGVVAAQAVDRFRTVAEARHQTMSLRSGSIACSGSCSTTPASTPRPAVTSRCWSGSRGVGCGSRSRIPGPASQPRSATASSTASTEPPRALAEPASASPSPTRWCGRREVAGKWGLRRPAARACRSRGRAVTRTGGDRDPSHDRGVEQ
jgi:hypothetical protein